MKRLSMAVIGILIFSLAARAEEAPAAGDAVTVFVTDKDGKQVDRKSTRLNSSH